MMSRLYPQGVSVIVRFHDPKYDDCLRNNLASLQAQAVPVQVILCLQNFSLQNEQACESLLADLRWSIPPKVLNVSVDCDDGRSLLANTGMGAADCRYLTFLDYDDILYPEAYSHLTDRLQSCDAALVLGRVIETHMTADVSGYRCVERHDVHTGSDQFDLFEQNFCPIHGFMIDRQRVDLAELFFDEQLDVLEDYDFLLRFFSRYPVDFSRLDQTIGEYRKYDDCRNTLPIRVAGNEEKVDRIREATKTVDQRKFDYRVNVSVAEAARMRWVDSYRATVPSNHALFCLLSNAKTKPNCISGRIDHVFGNNRTTVITGTVASEIDDDEISTVAVIDDQKVLAVAVPNIVPNEQRFMDQQEFPGFKVGFSHSEFEHLPIRVMVISRQGHVFELKGSELHAYNNTHPNRSDQFSSVCQQSSS